MILFLNGGISQDRNIWCINKLKNYIKTEEINTMNITEDIDWYELLYKLEQVSAVVLACDVHMDSIPAAVVTFLEKIEKEVINGAFIPGKFYAILHTSLYEGEQTELAMSMLKNFCDRANILWGCGLGIGGNQIIYAQPKVTCKKKWFGIKIDESSLISAIEVPVAELAMRIREHSQVDDEYYTPVDISRSVYMRFVNKEAKRFHRVKMAQN